MKNSSTLLWVSPRACYTPVELSLTEDLHSHILKEEPNQGGSKLAGQPSWTRIVHRGRREGRGRVSECSIDNACSSLCIRLQVGDVCDETTEKVMDQDS